MLRTNRTFLKSFRTSAAGIIRAGAAMGLAAMVSLALLAARMAATQEGDPAALRKKAAELRKQGNLKEALDLYKKLTLDMGKDPAWVGDDLRQSVELLRHLNQESETDALIEEAVKTHRGNWRLLQAAAESYLYHLSHYGFIVSGEFQRGQHRGGGRMVNAWERDRVRALQLMVQAMARIASEPGTSEAASFHQALAQAILQGRSDAESWRLQYLSDLASLPDYEEGYGYGWGPSGGSTRGAPVDETGEPIYYHLPKSWEEARNDGERWRWALMQAAELDPSRRAQVDFLFADFLWQQFGVQTMAEYGAFWRRQDDEALDREAGVYALDTLKEDETICRLASGIRRLTLPAEFNFIRIFQRVSEEGQDYPAIDALERLAQLFENRRQYEKAADYWRQVVQRTDRNRRQNAQARLGQITANWGMFEPVLSQAAGKGATVDYRFRNGDHVDFEAHAIRVDKLLADVKAYLRGKPQRDLNWEKVNIENIGYRLVQKDEQQYVGERAATWSLDLKPRPRHFDRRITVTTPLQQAGAYLLTARMKDGNVSRIIIWINDLAIVKKPVDKGILYFLADAFSGEPAAGATADFFGYRQNYIQRGKATTARFEVLVKEFTKAADAQGLVYPAQAELDAQYHWLLQAKAPDGRAAYLGFDNVWFPERHDRDYNETKIYTITDRPVYRPGQTVKFKFWVRNAKYDEEGKGAFANTVFLLRLQNPKGDKIFEKNYQTDDFGGFDGEYVLPADATLGQYSLFLDNFGGSGRFRVEEYKKPEFEVTIDAPQEPVMLGEKVPAAITAKYYFGAPVTKARVHYKVLRSGHVTEWYPAGIWDWYYGPGYWWFGYDYDWYPGWRLWGCRRPAPWWWSRQPDPPEVVMENEVEIGEDGTVKFDIDTTLAREMHGDQDHRYEITAEVVDQSRRTIVGKGQILVARKPFKVYVWLDRGHYRVGDSIQASFSAQTLDNKPVSGKGELVLYRVTYDKEMKPIETAAQKWDLNTDEQGRAQVQMKASEAGQYRLSYKVTDTKRHTIEGGYVFVITGPGYDGAAFRFNNVELVTDKREYAPGEAARLLVNTNRAGSTVLLFIRPANGVYLPPKVLRLTGKSVTEEIAVTKKDMPNFFIEAVTISEGRIHSETREVIVPPEKRILNAEVIASKSEYKPGETAKVRVKLTDSDGKPFVGSTVLAVYDKALEYISGGSNVPDIREFFWKWRRSHNPSGETNLERWFAQLLKPNETGMSVLGVFGDSVANMEGLAEGVAGGLLRKARFRDDDKSYMRARMPLAVPMTAAAPALSGRMLDESNMAMADGLIKTQDTREEAKEVPSEAESGAGGEAQPVIRTQFADTAYWNATLNTDPDGVAEVEFAMPENLTGWRVKLWAMGDGTRVGEAAADVTTKKNLLLRLQAPRFFIEKDEVVLSANIHNYLKDGKKVRAVLELEGPCLEVIGKAARTNFGKKSDPPREGPMGWTGEQQITVKAEGEERVDWRVKVVAEGEAVIRMKALTDEESDAMEMKFPVYVHGMEKQIPCSGYLKPDATSETITLEVPAQRRVNESRLEIRYSPTLAMAMVDALPYLMEYPYGCTEQTLNRFLPTVITQKVLLDTGQNLAAIREKISNLNAQEIGEDRERAQQWKRWRNPDGSFRNPVYDEAEVKKMVNEGVMALSEMQLSDGGWGWFSGYGERSTPHLTACVVHGLQIARENDAVIPEGVIERGVKWLERYQDAEVQKINNWPKEKDPRKRYADNMDAFVYMVLMDAGKKNGDMRGFLYRDRNELSVYAKSMFGIALHKEGRAEERDMIIRNIEQYLIRDDENQTAYLNLGSSGYWWHWYGSEYEAHAYYLKLLARTGQAGDWRAPYLVKYLLNNRKHATYWNSTRDTALVVEAFADYIRASGEDKPDMTVEVFVDGKKWQEVAINAENLFTFNNKFVLIGDAVETGKRVIELRKTGKGPLYFNAYLTYFSLEDFITKAGLEVRVNRDVYLLTPEDKRIKVAGARGQAIDQKVEKYKRTRLDNNDSLKSGDLVEVELTIESKNDYEYLVFEDMKAAGFEPVDVRSGYTGNEMGAYVEFRDNRVAFFVSHLARGKHSVSYRTRAEIPGVFSALPARGWAMYAPELSGNSDEIKLSIKD